MKKKICLITSTRADYGYLRPLISQIKKNQKLQLQIIATGTHPEKKYGNTINEITSEGNRVDAVVRIIHDDSKSGILATMSDGIKKVGEALELLKPDLVVVLGDRYEIFSIASSCVILGIPVAHVSGGDVTHGAYDDIFRHCLTKMSHLHFPSCDEYKKRVIQLGEAPQRVFSVGSLAVENIFTTKLLSKSILEKELGFTLDDRLLATFHPVTMEVDSQEKQFAEFLSAIAAQENFKFIFTRPNADTNRESLVKMLNDFAKKYPQKIAVVDSLGSLKYLSVMKYCAGVIGNSSSGIIETPSLKKGTINIGNRQKGRVSAKSVIHCAAKKDDILKALKKLASADFQKSLSKVKNPYEKAGTAKNIVKKIEVMIVGEIRSKQFFDLK